MLDAILENTDADAAILDEIARLKADNDRLRTGKKLPKQPKGPRVQPISLRVSQKGAISVYGLGKFPITLYEGTWKKLLAPEFKEALFAFADANRSELAQKGQPQEVIVQGELDSRGFPINQDGSLAVDKDGFATRANGHRLKPICRTYDDQTEVDYFLDEEGNAWYWSKRSNEDFFFSDGLNYGHMYRDAGNGEGIEKR